MREKSPRSLDLRAHRPGGAHPTRLQLCNTRLQCRAADAPALTATVGVDQSTRVSASSPRALNRLRLFRAYVSCSEPLAAEPTAVYVESTSRCNLGCPMCARQLAGPEWRDTDMPVELFERALDALGPGCELVLPFAGGEPLLRPDVGDLVAECRARGLSTELATNATLLDGRASVALLEAGLDTLVVSLDAATAETYERLRRGGCFERTCANVRTFLRWKKRLRAPTWVVLQMIALPDNRDEAAAFRRQWRSVAGVDAVRVKADEVRTAGAGQQARPDGARRGPCQFPWIGPALIRYDGAVYPCCHAWRHEPVGDVRTSTLAEVWQGPAMAALRRAHAEGRWNDVPACRECQAVEPRRWLVAASLGIPPRVARRAIPIAESANRYVGRWMIR